MAVYINQPDAFERMVQVEGEDWRRHQEEGRMGKQAFKPFLEEWTRLNAQFTAEERASEYFSNREVGLGGLNSSIYGYGGWTRYIVKFSGEIVFMRDLAPNQAAIDRAVAAGFRVWPEGPADFW